MLDRNLQSQLEIGKAWQARLRDAEEAYRERQREVAAIYADQEFREALGSDAWPAFREALRQETHALREYQRVLRIFTDLVVRGVVPPEENAAE